MGKKIDYKKLHIIDLLEKTKLHTGGFFFIKRGVNLCGVESNTWTAEPNVDNLIYQANKKNYKAINEYPKTFKLDISKNNHFWYEKDTNLGTGQYRTQNAILSGDHST